MRARALIFEYVLLVALVLLAVRIYMVAAL